VSSVSNGLYFLTLPLVSVMHVIYTSIGMSKKFGLLIIYTRKGMSKKFGVHIIHGCTLPTGKYGT
jgi:hypothetical protein